MSCLSYNGGYWPISMRHKLLLHRPGRRKRHRVQWADRIAARRGAARQREPALDT